MGLSVARRLHMKIEFNAFKMTLTLTPENQAEHYQIAAFSHNMEAEHINFSYDIQWGPLNLIFPLQVKDEK